MELIEVQYINKCMRKKNISVLAFVILISVGYLVAIGALCSI